ncbi:SCP2 sterol-binding domain-containing protein [Orrella sp. JC864]|uniref:SCP2 sterol-binding domain-containing protein n=1 Tax=Orrella sp. JC864 TaxID=3120298 RepID=UPI0012BD06F7
MLPVFPPSFAFLAARAINALLEREPWARQQLARHAGKTVRLALGGFGLSLTVAEGGRFMQASRAAEPAVTFTMLPERIDPARLLAGPAVQGQAYTDMTHVSGDASLAQTIGELARHLRPDPEDELARLLGDIPALRLMGGLRAAGEGVRQAAQRLAGNAAEYLSEESALLAGRPLLQAWRSELDRTSARLDRTAERLAALESRLRRLPAARS